MLAAFQRSPDFIALLKVSSPIWFSVCHHAIYISAVLLPILFLPINIRGDMVKFQISFDTFIRQQIWI